MPDGQPGEAGAFVFTQKWVHDLTAFHAQPQREQEGTIGRTKPDSIELDDKPPTAHIARVVIEEDGEELELYRRSVPYGRVGELGLYFLAFSADPSRFTKMLHRMVGLTGVVKSVRWSWRPSPLDPNMRCSILVKRDGSALKARK